MEAANQPGRNLAGQAETGRACPYCRFPLKEGIEIAVCAECTAPHHRECWDENGGCAVVACAGGPSAASTQSIPAYADAAPQPTGATAAVPSWPQPQPQPRPRTSPWLVAGLFVLALAVAGGATAVVVAGGRDSARENSVAPPPAPATVTETVETPVEPEPEPVPTSSDVLSQTSDEEIRSEIYQTLYDHHAAVVSGDFEQAWAVLSKRKQAQNRQKYGYATWRANQATLSPHLDPSGLDVSVIDVDPDAGEATVRVTGMTWSKPGADCTEWSGITWMKYEDGFWRYDPGYSTTPQRERLWKPRFPELLGASC
jgi:Prokaryotic RING finger family 1